MVMFGESAVGQQNASQVGEGLEVVGFAFVAAHESAVALQPRQAGLDDPAVSAEAF